MIDFHRKLLGDRIRNQAFFEALKKVIIPGESVVADIGAGTGFLSFLARRLGAKNCHLYEYGDVMRIAKEMAKRNEIDGLRFVRRHSTQVKRPVKADIIVAEVLGNYALEEHIIETLADAKDRFLKQGGTLIPCALEQFVAPVVTDRLSCEIDIWSGVDFDFDWSAAREVTLHNMYVKTVRPDDLLSGPDAVQRWDRIDFLESPSSQRRAELRWKPPTETTILGFALWWKATLVPGVTLSTGPSDPPTHWEQIFLPLLRPIKASKGSEIVLLLSSDTRWKTGVNVTWEAVLLDAGRKEIDRQKMDMREGHID